MKSSKFNAAIEQWAKTIPGNTPKHEFVESKMQADIPTIATV